MASLFLLTGYAVPLPFAQRNATLKRIESVNRLPAKSVLQRATALWTMLVTSVVETWYLTVPLGLLAFTCFLLWKYSTALTDFGLNAFTEILGIIVTVVLVEQLIRQQELRRGLPLQAAAFEDVRLLVIRIINFWHDVFQQAVPLPAPTTVDDLFQTRTFEMIRMNLDLDSRPNVTPARTWWQWLPQREQEFHLQATHILERHPGNLEPAAYALVHKLTTSFLQPSAGLQLLPEMKQSDKEHHYPRPHVLAYYWQEYPDSLETVVALHKWCCRKKNELERYGVHGLKPVTQYWPDGPVNLSPPSMIRPEEFQKQLQALEAFYIRLRASSEEPRPSGVESPSE